jgi:hypothetical protein
MTQLAPNSIDAFVERANQHQPTTMELDDGRMRFRCEVTSQGRFTKSIIELSASEPAAVRRKFAGKSMWSDFPRGGFRRAWLASLTRELESFKGPLKRAIYEMLIALAELDAEKGRGKPRRRRRLATRPPDEGHPYAEALARAQRSFFPFVDLSDAETTTTADVDNLQEELSGLTAVGSAPARSLDDAVGQLQDSFLRTSCGLHVARMNDGIALRRGRSPRFLDLWAASHAAYGTDPATETTEIMGDALCLHPSDRELTSPTLTLVTHPDPLPTTKLLAACCRALGVEAQRRLFPRPFRIAPGDEHEIHKPTRALDLVVVIRPFGMSASLVDELSRTVIGALQTSERNVEISVH